MILSLIAQGAGEEGVDLGETFQLADGQPVREVFGTPSDLINIIVPNLFVIAGVAAMVLIIVAGYQYIVLGEKGIEQAKKIANGLIIGLIVIFGAYWAIQVIQSITGADIRL